MMGVAVRSAAPDVGAVLRSLIGVVVVAGVGLSVIGPAAALAAGAAAAIAGATALQDTPHGRFPLVIGVSVTMGAAVLLGAAASAHWVLFAFVVTVWSFWAGMTWAAGSNAGLIAAAASALLVLAPPIGARWTEVCASAGLAVLGGLAQAALIAVWPRRRWRVQREALARAYGSLAADARRLAQHPAGTISTEHLTALRRVFALTPSQAGRRPLSYRTWYGLPERIGVTLVAMAHKSTGGDAAARVLTAAADVLDAVARPTRASAKLVGPAMDRFDATVAEAGDPGDVDGALVARLSAQLGEASAIRFGASSPAHSTQLRRRGLSGAIARTVTLAREQLLADSPVLRHAVRLGLGSGLGVVIARSADVAHGYWIPLTVVMVLRPETAHTYTRCVGRVAGNLVGVVVATLVAALLNPSGLVAVVLAVAFLGVAYAVTAWGYLAVTAALAAAIVLLADTTGTADVAIMGDRVLATLIGGVLAVLAHVALPDRVAVRLRQRAGELLKAEIDYAAKVIKSSVHDVERPGDQLAAAWERALRARAAFEASAASGLMDDRNLRRWLSSYRAGLNAVTAACAALEANLPARRAAETSTALTSAVDEYVEALRGDPQTAGSAWTLDVAALVTAVEMVRTELAGVDDPSGRVLLNEIDSVTRHLVQISRLERVSEPTSG